MREIILFHSSLQSFLNLSTYLNYEKTLEFVGDITDNVSEDNHLKSHLYSLNSMFGSITYHYVCVYLNPAKIHVLIYEEHCFKRKITNMSLNYATI